MAPQVTTIATLPYEILSHIFQFIDIHSLKQSRLASRPLEPAASSVLFSTIHLTTTTASLAHATSIGRSAKFSAQVKSLTYHASALIPSAHGSLDEPTGTFAAGPRNPAEFATYLSRFSSSSRQAGLPLERASAAADDYDAQFFATDPVVLWQEYVGIWRARLDLESQGYVSARLRGLLRWLPNVAGVRLVPVLPGARYVPGEHIPFFSRVDEEAFTDVLSACYDREGVRCLRAQSLHWGSFRPCDDLSGLCANLRELDLVIDDRSIGFPYSYMRMQFDAFLGECRSLEVLALDLGANPQWETNVDDVRAACNSVLGRVWSRLKKVRLTGFIAREEDLTTFFTTNAASLLRVEMEPLVIVIPLREGRSGEGHNDRHYVRAALRSTRNGLREPKSVSIDVLTWGLLGYDADQQGEIYQTWSGCDEVSVLDQVSERMTL